MKLPEKIRLQRMIALSSDLSRRAAEEAISRGEVSINGNVVTEPGITVNPFVDRVCLKGRLLCIVTKRKYLAYHKPKGFLVTKSDPFGRPMIWDRLKEWKGKLNAVGRLDFDSEGLILLTDDGDFINRLTHPRHEIWKTYRVWVRGEPSPKGLELLKNGVRLEDGKTLPARVSVKRMDEDNSLIEISIREGRNRQVRRMFAAIGCPVRSLERIAIGPVKLGRLKSGEWRELRSDEVRKLKQMTEHT